MINWLMVGLGGAIGAMTRYGLSLALPRVDANSFPSSTLIANLVGCLLIGVLWNSLSKSPHWLSQFLIIGILGGFTTFSSFGLESVQLFKAGKLGLAGLYVGISTLGGILCVFLGYGLSKGLN